MSTRRSIILGAAGAAITGTQVFHDLAAPPRGPAADGTAGPAAGTLGASAGAAAAAGPRWTGGTRALTRHAAGLGAGFRMERTRFPVSHLSIDWSGPGRVLVRARSAAGWGPWQVAGACGGGRDGWARGRRSSLLTVPGTTGYEIASDGGLGDLLVTELNAVTARVAEADEGWLGGTALPVRYRSRAAWGADESVRFDATGAEIWPPEYFPVQTLTVHHTATANDDPDPAATVRAVYHYHAVTQGWGDVGYHLLIDESGTVYEGRWSGADPVPVFGGAAAPDHRPQMVNAGHVGGFNAGNIGVALLGDFTSRPPTRAARRALAVVLATLAGIQRLDPLATADYVNPITGAGMTVDGISGHRDWQPTECPGGTLHAQLPAVRREVRRLLGTATP